MLSSPLLKKNPDQKETTVFPLLVILFPCSIELAASYSRAAVSLAGISPAAGQQYLAAVHAKWNLPENTW
jgi:hypothetical protein